MANIFFYHPDHLGSSSYITGQDGKVSQHTEYIAFGEILFDEHNTEHTMPYLFNGKELDQETGLYYYGARYYDPKVSIFVNVDPLVEKTMSAYAYTYNNPISLIDPTGKEPEDWVKRKNEDGSTSWVWREDIKARYQAIEAGYIDYAQPGYVYMAQKSFNEQAPVRLGDNGEWHFMGFIEQLTYTGYHENPYLHIIDHSKIPTIRRTPDTNSPEYAMSTPSGRLALAGLEGLKGATTGIATEYALAKIGLATKLSWSGSSIASDGINGLGVQTTFSSKGISMGQAIDMIPKNFSYIGGLKKGKGFKFADPTTNNSNQILLEYGNPASRDILHSGPYIKINQNGTYIERIPLKGNPALNIGK